MPSVTSRCRRTTTAPSTFSLDTPNDHVDVVGQDRYYQISLGHRFAYVRAADVDVVKAQ